ncbi:MAG: DUF790 family protein [Rubrobacteraceae bacterium]
MLRGEHVMARLSRGQLVPHRLSPQDGRVLEVADELCATYAACRGVPRFRLDEELAEKEEELGPRLDQRRGFKILRALAKLLEERAEWRAPTDADPYTVRTRIFEVAATLPEPPTSEPGLLQAMGREDVLSQVARETGLEDPARLMHADRAGAQVLETFERPSAEELVERYNVAQVQGVLYAARELVVELGREVDLRLVFHYVKLMDLIYRLEPAGDGHRLYLDGPLSLFGSTRKYGIRLAKFLPGLMLTAPWNLSASVEWRGREATLQLDSQSFAHQSHYTGPKAEREAGDTRAAFVKAWERANTPKNWRLASAASVLQIPERRAALVPDFTLKDQTTGAEVHLEIIGFWSERTLVDRATLIREAEKRGHRLLIAASENLGPNSEGLSGALRSAVVFFKGRLKVKDVLDAIGIEGS